MKRNENKNENRNENKNENKSEITMFNTSSIIKKNQTEKKIENFISQISVSTRTHVRTS